MDTLTPEEVSAFMYLNNQIKKKESFKKAKNKPREVAINGSYEDYHKATTKTIRRAFRLYDNLYAKKILYKDYNRPSRETLDVLAQYYLFYEGCKKTKKSQVFEYFKKMNKKEIQDYGSRTQLLDKELDAILNKKQPKVEQIKNHKTELVKYREHVKKLSLDEFMNLWIRFPKKKTGSKTEYLNLKERLVSYMSKGIRKSKTILFWYSIFGTAVFIFVSIPEYLDIRDYLIDILDGLYNNHDLESEFQEEQENNRNLVVIN